MSCPICRKKMTNGEPGLYKCPSGCGELFLKEYSNDSSSDAAEWWLSQQRYTKALRDEKRTTAVMLQHEFLRRRGKYREDCEALGLPF